MIKFREKGEDYWFNEKTGEFNYNGDIIEVLKTLNNIESSIVGKTKEMNYDPEKARKMVLSLLKMYDSITIKQEEWEPYEGPQGGEGWRSLDSGEIIYSDEPPGPVAGDSGTRDRSGQDEDRVKPEGVPNNTLDINANDVEDGDYINIDGEVEGYVDFVDIRGDNEAFVMFEDGTSLPVTEDMEVYIDDNPPEKSQYQMDIDKFGEKLFNTTEIEFEGEFLSREDVINKVSSDMARCKSEDMAMTTLEGLSEVSSISSNRSYYNSEENLIALSDGVFEETVSHEFAHAFLAENGYNTGPFANIIATATNASLGRGIPDDVQYEGQTRGELARDLHNHGYISDDYMEQIEEATFEIGAPSDPPVKPEEFMLRTMRDSEDNAGDLRDAINEVFKDQYEIAVEGTNGRIIKDEYAATNAQETFAGIHEEMQKDGVSHKTVSVLYEDYPEFLTKYIEYFEPNTMQKQYFNKLFNEEGSSGTIDEIPFPEVE